MKEKLILVGTTALTFLLNILCYSLFQDNIWNTPHPGIFLAGLLYTPVIILVFFVVALLAVKRLCSKKGISLARFAVALSALELVVHYVGFYICGKEFGWLISELWGIYYDLIVVEALLIIGIILFVSLVVLYTLCRAEGCLHPAVNPSLRFILTVGLVVAAAYGVAFCLMMFCIALLAQDIIQWFAGKILAYLVLFILVPGNCIAVSLLAKRLINKFSFLKEQFASLAILCANLLYPGCFYYSWNNMIWDEIYGLPLNMPAMWQVLLAVQAVWSIVLMIKLIYTVISNKAKSEGK